MCIRDRVLCLPGVDKAAKGGHEDAGLRVGEVGVALESEQVLRVLHGSVLPGRHTSAAVDPVARARVVRVVTSPNVRGACAIPTQRARESLHDDGGEGALDPLR